MEPVSAGQEHGLGGTRERGVLPALSPGLKALGKGHVDVRSSKIGSGPVGVEMFVGHIAEIDPLGAAPVYEVLGAGKLETPVAIVPCTALLRAIGSALGLGMRTSIRVTKDDGVSLPERIPEDDVEGVESVSVKPFFNQRFLSL